MIDPEEIETIDLSDYPSEFRIALLEELGFETDGEFIFKDDKLVKDRYTDKPVRVEEMAILPGKEQGEVIIIEDCVFSLIHYFTEFEE
jgi:hypothetical protein